MPNRELEDRLQELRRSFVAQLPERLAGLEKDLEAFSRSGDNGALRRAQAEAHVLKGSGATFGAPDISRAASTLDDHLVDILQGGTPTPRSAMCAVDHALQELRRCVFLSGGKRVGQA